MCKHAIPVEIIIEDKTWALAREQVANLLARAQVNHEIFHYKIINGEAEA